jgi:transcriptional regulator with XRE-family HTH domain
MTDIKKKLGVRISRLRADAHMSQEKLAERANLSINVIGRIEKGDRAPALKSLEKIAEALGIDPAEILNFKGKEFKALTEGPQECLELWNLLKNKKRDQIKKLSDIAKIILS